MRTFARTLEHLLLVLIVGTGVYLGASAVRDGIKDSFDRTANLLDHPERVR